MLSLKTAGVIITAKTSSDCVDSKGICTPALIGYSNSDGRYWRMLRVAEYSSIVQVPHLAYPPSATADKRAFTASRWVGSMTLQPESKSAKARESQSEVEPPTKTFMIPVSGLARSRPPVSISHGVSTER